MKFPALIAAAGVLVLSSCIQSGVFEPKDPSFGMPSSYSAPIMGKVSEYSTSVHELSSLCLSRDGSSLWGVSDDNKTGKGGLYAIGFDGSTEKKISILRDLEGVTINPATGDLYLAVEGEQAIYHVSPSLGTPELLGTVTDNGARNPSGKGLEGITWYKNDTLIVANQQDPTVLSFFSLKSGKAERHVGISNAGYLSDLCYDPVDDVLWISDTSERMIYIVAPQNGTLLAAYQIPSSVSGKAEGLCVDHANGCIWLGCDDTSKLHRVSMTWK